MVLSMCLRLVLANYLRRQASLLSARRRNPEWLFLENMRSVFRYMHGNFIGYVISTIKIYALLTKHEVKKLDILRFMDRKFPIIFTLIWGGKKSAGKQSEYGFRGPSGTFPGDTPRASFPRCSCLACVTSQRTSARGAIPGLSRKGPRAVVALM